MEKKQSSVQSILLIDTFRPGHLNNDDAFHKYRALTLASFRILKYLQSSIHALGDSEAKQKLRKDTGLKWSFKFFNSRSYKAAVKQDKLRDFKLRYFEQYEAKLEERLQMPTEKVGKTLKITPAECVQKALTEIVTDIEWETPDIASPMKGRRRLKQLQAPKNHNVVFLFTNLPSNSQQMRMFAGKRVLDCEILLDAIMPPHLFEQFHHHANLSLFWIDITSLNISSTPDSSTINLPDMKCVEIITSTLNRVGGSVIQVDSLLNMGHSHNWSLGKFSQLKELPTQHSEQKTDAGGKNQMNANCINPVSCLFPSDTIVGSFTMFPRPQKDLTSTCCHAQLKLCMDGQTVNITLKLEPTFRSGKCVADDITVTAQSSTPAVPVESASRLFTLSLGKEPVSQTCVSVVQSQQYRAFLIHNLEFKIHSCMSKSLASLYPVVGATSFCASVDDQGEMTGSEVFEDLMSELENTKNVLVLTVRAGDQACPHLALMEKFSCHTAFITLLPLGGTLQMEKAYLHQTEECLIPPQVTTTNSALARLSRVCKLESSMVKAKFTVNSLHEKHQTTMSKITDPSQCYNPQVLNSWHLPGTSKGLPSLICKLNSRLQDLDFLTQEEKQTLKALQKMYRKDNQPQALLQKSCPQPDLKQGEKVEVNSEENDQQRSQSGKAGNSKLNRGMMMVKRSKAAVKRCSKTEEEVEACQVDRQTDKLSVNMTNLDLQTEESLGQYLKEVYTKTLDQGSGLESSVQNMVTVAVHFQKEKGDNSEIEALSLLRREVILSNSALREKYKDKTSEEDKNMKITEYKLQVMLLLEMESAVLSFDESHIEKCVDEVVNLLRTLSFISDSGVVPNFLNKVIVTSYAPTLPQLLVSVYDELMQPLPDSLAMFASPNKSADSSVLNTSLQSNDSMQDPGSQPGSNKSDILQSNRTLRSRRLVQHPSLSDYGSKKQIMVMKKPAAGKQPKEKAKEKEKIKRQKSAQAVTKLKKSKAKPEIVKVRRNLFEGDHPKLERRQSVAVMERTRKSPHKRLTDSSFKSPRASKSPATKRRSVAETPAHKQMSNVVWNRQEKKRKRTSTEEDVDVVQESPMKQWEDNFKKVSPSRNKHAVNMMRRSFYSAGPRNRSRNLTKYFQFADRIAGRQQRQSLGDLSGSQPKTQVPHKSPSRSSFLMSQLMCSPSPRHKTPSKTSRSATGTTPKHTVQESPFRNTRSKTPRKFSKVLLFDTPKKQHVSNRDESCRAIVSPTKHHRTPRKQGNVSILFAESPGPVTRSHTPSKVRTSPSSQEYKTQVNSHHIQIPTTPKRTPQCTASSSSLLSPPPLTPQRSILKSSQSSTTKRLIDLPSTPQRTPKPSHGLVSESPSQNTRSKNTTPGRNSVCTALFGASSRATPRNKLFSVVEMPGETRSPKRRVHFDKIEDVSATQTDSLSHSDTDFADLHNPTKMFTETLTNVSFMNKDGSVTSLCMKTSPSASKSSEAQRTPSPQKQQKVRTPDSFDKWPRRKRRWASPTQTSSQKENVGAFEGGNTESTVLSEANQLQIEDAQQLKRRVSSVSRKRSFLESVQDSSTMYSPNKRSRTSWTDSLSSKDTRESRYYCLHQHVTTISSEKATLSMNSSQTSTSALDYFSSTNDEVFLTGNSQESQPSSFVSTRSQINSVTRSESPVFGTSPSITRLVKDHSQDPSPSSQGFEVTSDREEFVASPKFQTSPVLAANKSTSISKHTELLTSKFVSPDPKSSRPQQASPSSGKGLSTSPVYKSPHPGTSSVSESPRDRKFSPSVSARSLVHLMNSPLIKPDQNILKSPSKTRGVSERSHFKSRKSLNMQK